MPSPFPGMEPCIESQAWSDFYSRLVTEISFTLVPRIRPHYVVRIEERVYVEHVPNGHLQFIRPDMTMLEPAGHEALAAGAGAAAPALTVMPVVLTLPLPERVREVFLTIRERETMAVITVIEVLSPGNKRSGSDGRREYLSKRESALQSTAHLVELDLLRGGERLPTIEPLPSADYYAFVCREQRRPRVEVCPWTLRHPLPPIPIPLAGTDPDVVLDLPSIFHTVYDRTGYDYSLDYRRAVEPPLNNGDAAWMRQSLATANRLRP